MPPSANRSHDTHSRKKVIRTDLIPDSVKHRGVGGFHRGQRHGRSSSSDGFGTEVAVATRLPVRVELQLSVGARPLFLGAMTNVVLDLR